MLGAPPATYTQDGLTVPFGAGNLQNLPLGTELTEPTL